MFCGRGILKLNLFTLTYYSVIIILGGYKMLKQKLVEAYQEIKSENNFTYKDMAHYSGLNEVQLSNILNHNARKVSSDIMVIGLEGFGIGVDVNFYQIGEDE